jgi:hypothetical protein
MRKREREKRKERGKAGRGPVKGTLYLILFCNGAPIWIPLKKESGPKKNPLSSNHCL